ncbi:MAG: D-cysteine desulfhydrase family protein [Planctomycetota bacterium]|nr:D-cysteine desulfhydrase family protein [Planctomycetota bacterium]
MDIERRLKGFPRERLAILPTPVHRLDRLSEALRADIWIIRDDMTGTGLGGNKVRKLEFLLAEARRRGCDIVLTAGANQSNHCRLTAACCARLGMEACLILGGGKPAAPSGNLLLDLLFGARIRHVNSKDWAAWTRRMEEEAEALRRRGRKPFAVPIGGSTPIGALGYAAAAAEYRQSFAKLGIRPQAIYLAVSSAGTQAGLLAGTLAMGWDMPAVGIGVAKDEKALRREVADIARGACGLLGADPRNVEAAVHVDANYIGRGYAARTPECEKAVSLLARLEGLTLDYVYTGKAMAGLIDHIRTGRLRRDVPVVFLHTGGSVQLFE